MKIKRNEDLLNIMDNLFNPINNKDFGKYWNVSNNKEKPLANAGKLLDYIKRESPEGSFINRYANLESDLILENNIYLDFDLTSYDYLKAENRLTETALEQLMNEEILINKNDSNNVKNNKTHLKAVKGKYEKDYSIENGFSKGINNFIDGLTEAESKALKKKVEILEKEELKGKSEKEIQKYYHDNFEDGYLKEPFQEAIKVAKYFESIGVKCIINWSGGKGTHLRIPITTITFEGTELEENPENVKIFLQALAKLIETKILEKPYKKSSLDYQVFCKGMQRLPTSKHNKTKLYANFIEPSVNYLDAVDVLEKKVPSYIPTTIDLEKNTENLLKSKIYEATIRIAIEDNTLKTYDAETGNIAYKFKSKDHKKLKEMILEIYPESLNFYPFKVMHLLKRTGFTKEEVESIFHDIEPNTREYNKNFKGNIKYTFENPNAKICGLRNLIEWIKENYPNHEKDHVIKYFLNNFSYYEKPTEKILEDVAIINEKEYNLTEYTTKNNIYYVINNFIKEDYSLEVNKTMNYLFIKRDGKTKAKLELKKELGVKPKSQDKLKAFTDRIEKRTKIDFDVPETIEELDLIIEEHELQEQEEEINESIIEDAIEDITEEKTKNDEFNFGYDIYEDGSYYSQTDLFGIRYVNYKKNEKGEFEPNFTPIANVVIKDVTIILDALKILEPVYNITYFNKTFNKEVTVEHLTKKQLFEEFIKANVFHKTTKENVETVLNSFIIDGTKQDRIKVKTEAYLEGFFIVDGKVVENTELKNLKKYTSEDVAEAINLLNKIMEDRSEEGKRNDSTVYRFMLWNPFSYCFKQLGYSKANYSLILIGASQTNKTGATKIGNLFYNRKEEETSGSTVSVLGSKIGENSFCSMFDECSHLFNMSEALNVMKRAIYERTGRAVKDKNDNTKIDEFVALNLPVFILNPEGITFKDFIINRYKIVNYSLESFINKSDIEKFNEKYYPEAPDTILNKLALIGKEFSKKLIAIIENPNERNKLFNIEETTIEILKEIQTEAGVEFNKAMLTGTGTSTKYNYDVKAEIPKILNNEFKQKNRLIGNSSYSGYSFVNSVINNDFDFITYNKNRTEKTKAKEFIINTSKLEKYINYHVEEYVEIETILEALNLTDILKSKKDYKEPYSKYIKKNHKIQINEGSKTKDKTISGIYLTVEELANNLFNFDIDFSNNNEDESEFKYNPEKVENKN